MRPKRATASSATPRMAAGSVTSAAVVMTPSGSDARATASRAVATTDAPRSAADRAVMRPMPLAAPTTTTT